MVFAGTQSFEQLGQRILAASSGGSSLSDDVRDRLENHLDIDLSNVKLHTDSEADHLARSPHVFDVLLDPEFFGPLPNLPELKGLLGAQLVQALDYEGKLDAARRFAREQMFRVGAQIIEGTVSGAGAGLAFSEIAESALHGLLPGLTTGVWVRPTSQGRS